MEDIKVGEYVRTEIQGIKRIDIIFENRPVNRYGYEIGSEWDGKLYSTIKTTEIVNHSFNILDLIEVGDIGVLDCYAFKVKKVLSEEDILELKAKNYELLEILTKEQFNRGKYVVNE